MNLNHVRYFLAVVETGSFTKAAERANVTQPTLSAGIRRLEDRLGATLFERGRNVVLTPAGARFAPRARTLVQEWSAARTDARAATGRRHLRLGLLRGLPGQAAARLFGDFARAHPDIDLEIGDGSAAVLDRRLELGLIDAALTYLPAEADRERAVPLLRQRHVIMAPDSHPLARRNTCRLAELQGQAFVLGPDSPMRREAQRLFVANGITVRVVARVDDDERALALVAAGLGLAWLPDWCLTEGVVPVTLAELDRPQRIGLIGREAAPEVVRQFGAFAASHDWAGISGRGPLTVAH